MRREIVQHERTQLQARLRELEPWVVPALQRQSADAVKKMLLSWGAGGKSMTPAEAAAILTEYAMKLGAMPLWAVERACARWGAGSVTPAEIGLDPTKGGRIDWAFPPSAPQVVMVARALAQPYFNEVARIKKILDHKALPKPKDMKAKGLIAAKEYVAERRRAEEEEAHARRRAPSPGEQHQQCLRAWAAMGLEPPKLEPGKILCLPTTYLSLGWTIHEETVMGEVRRSLLPPPAMEPPPEVETRPARRAGSFKQAAEALDDEIPF